MQKYYLEYIEKACQFRRQFENDSITGNATANGQFYYIPTGEPSNLFMLLDKLKAKKGSFCDAGCGYPMFPLLALKYGFKNAVGIESVNEYVEHLKNEFSNIIIHSDIFLHDYSKYDVIYSYVPVWGKHMIKFTNFVKSQMKENAIFVVHGLDNIVYEDPRKIFKMKKNKETGLYYFKNIKIK